MPHDLPSSRWAILTSASARAVELSQADVQFRGSPELVAHLVTQAEGDALRVNAAVVIPFGSIVRWALAFLPVLALWMFFTFNGHTATIVLRGLFSTLQPWKSPPAILADVAVKPGDQVIAQGDSLQIIATVSTNGGKPAKNVKLVRAFATGQQVSQDLQQTKGTEFSLNLDDQQQSFKYFVETDRGNSVWYTVTVNPRPAIARLDVRYDYPKYTGLTSKTLTATDGNIDAVAGTKITVSVHTTHPVVTDKSQLVFNDDTTSQNTLPLAAVAEKNVYEAKFDVVRSGTYRLQLLNEYNLANKDDGIRSITAQPDEPPTISITSPKEQITVRPDDEVTIMYLAADDYGVAHIDALIQVDDRPERAVPVTIHSKNLKDIKDNWRLSIPALLRQEGVAEASRISYQLKATDNRDPAAQTGLSARQTLLVSKSENRSFQDKLNEMRKTDLQAAIRKAIDRLNQDYAHVASFREFEVRHALDAVRLQEAAGVRDHLSNTSKDLSSAAGDYLDTPFADVAKAAKNIADNDIAKAAEDTARLSLDTAEVLTAKNDATRALKGIAGARDALERLLQKAEEAQRKAEAAQALKDAAHKQEEVAKAMEQHPEKQDENRQKQQDAINKLQEAMQKDPTLQNKEAQKMAAKLAELENKIEQDQQKQTELQNQTAKQEEKQQAQEAANALAETQKKLNEEVQQFAKDDKKAIDQAHAQTPDANQQKELVKNIEKNQLQQAAQQAQQQADQLKQDADKLKDQAKHPENNPTADQQKQKEQDQQNQQDAQNAQNQANQAAQDLKNQAQQKDPNADTAKQNAEKTVQAAQQIQKQAEKIQQQNNEGAKDADVQAAAEAAKTDAQQAAKDAQAAADAPNPQDAQQGADKAAAELAKAGQELNQAAQAEAKADGAKAQKETQQAAAQAADKAQGLADKQKEIAQALGQQAQQQADAGQPPSAQQSAAEQKEVAKQTQSAQQTAQQLAQQAKAQQDPALAQRADDASKALDQAAQAQQEAAKAEAANKPGDAAQAQADAQKALAQAEQALRGNPEQAQANADPAQGQPDQGQGKPEQGQPKQSAAQAAQQAAQSQQQALQPNPAAAADAAQALAQAAQAAQQGLPGQGPPEQGPPGTEPGQGEEPSPIPGQTPDSKQGISGTDSGGNNEPPAAVKAIGISASDWAKLPPMMQRELMNASQQSGPPAYKEMIKNYYIRVAHMQNEKPDAGPKQ